jgi:hypothetical protein
VSRTPHSVIGVFLVDGHGQRTRVDGADDDTGAASRWFVLDGAGVVQVNRRTA